MKRFSLIALFLLSGCGYGLVGRTNFLDPSIRSLEVPAFVNKTTRGARTARDAGGGGGVRVARADARHARAGGRDLARGSIDTFNIFPISFEQGRAALPDSITAKIEPSPSQRRQGAEERPVPLHRKREVNLGTTGCLRPGDARSEIAVRFAEGLVTNLLEGF
jgi:hypothetical protein